MTLPEIIARLEGFSTKDLERLAHEIQVILYARDEEYTESLAKKQAQGEPDPLSQHELV